MIAPEPETIYPPIEAETPIPPELQYELERDRLIKIEMERNINIKRGEDQSSSSDKNDRWASDDRIEQYSENYPIQIW